MRGHDKRGAGSGSRAVALFVAFGCSTGCPTQPPDLPASGTSTSTTGATSSDGGPAGTTTDPDPSTTGATNPGTTTDPTSGNDATSTGPGQGSEILSNGPQATCTEPLWCFVIMTMEPTGGPIGMQECFVATTPPPYSVQRVTVWVGDRVDQLGEINLEVRPHDTDGPGALIASQGIDPASLQIGPNVIELDPPVTVEFPEVCIGFDAPGPGLSSAIGFAVDTSVAQPNVSWIRMGGAGACAIPDFADVIALAPMPTGNWCLTAEIVAEP